MDGASPPAAELSPGQLQTRIRYELVGYRPRLLSRTTRGLLADYMASLGICRISRTTLGGAGRNTEPLHCLRAISTSRLRRLAAMRHILRSLLHGTDYWRTVLDGACGIDVYGHNGVSVGDIDGDGFDDFYVCQPGGLPNRLYRNRGDGTFDDITEASGVGVIENTACALFVDVDNDGRQDLIVVRACGPMLFLNEGGGKFRQKANAFHFATPPQGTFTGAAVADLTATDGLIFTSVSTSITRARTNTNIRLLIMPPRMGLLIS